MSIAKNALVVVGMLYGGANMIATEIGGLDDRSASMGGPVTPLHDWGQSKDILRKSTYYVVWPGYHAGPILSDFSKKYIEVPAAAAKP